MTQTDGLQALFEALLRSEWPLVAERAIVSVGYSQKEFEVSPCGPRVEIRFGRQAYGSPNLMQIVHEAGRSAEQLLTGAATKPRLPSRLVELHERGAPLTDGNQQLAKVMLAKDRAMLGCAKDWLWDCEGIRASLRPEGNGRWALRVPAENAQMARASLRLFRDEWKAVS